MPYERLKLAIKLLQKKLAQRISASFSRPILNAKQFPIPSVATKAKRHFETQDITYFQQTLIKIFSGKC